MAPVALSLILVTLAAAPIVASWRLAEPAAASPAREAPALPEPRPGTPATLSGQLDPLPLIPTDLPDPASRAAAERLRTVPVQDGPAGRQAFVDLWAALPAGGADREGLDQLGSALLTDQAVATSGDQDAATLQIDERLAPLQGAPANGDRLDDAALALLAVALAQIEGTPVPGVAPPAALLHHASTLLDTAVARFPDSRALTLDRALLARLPGTLTGRTAPLPALEAWVNGHPQDRTARYLLAQQLATGGQDARLTGQTGVQPGSVPGAEDRSNLARALGVLQPLLQQAPALGYAARGDAELAAADLVVAEAPGAARESAWAAVTDYDRALRLNADPGLYAARGAALTAIAAPDPDPEDGPVYREAVRSLQVAHGRQPQAVSFTLQLANLDEKTGDVESMRTHARQAMRAAAKARPALGDVRLTAAPRPSAIFGGGAANLTLSSGDRGFGGSSVGSGSPQLPVWPVGQQGAGTYEPADDLVPASRIPDLDAVERAGSPLDAGTTTALRADVLLGDTQAAAADRAAWDAAAAPTGGALADLRADRARVVHGYAAAVALVTGGTLAAGSNPDQTLALASTTLRRAGRYSDAAGVCERAGAGALVADRAVAYECAGESWYLAGPDHSTRARDDLAEARRQTAAQGPRTAAVGDELVLESATVQAQHQPDQLQQARDALAGLATKQASAYRAIAWKVLGDLALDRHDPRAALSAYDRAIQAFDARRDAVNSQAVAAARLAHVNRAIARLAQAQPSPNVPPCRGSPNVCETARTDLIQALQQDPGDAVAHVNLARVDRLQSRAPGDARDREARAEGAQAVQMDPRLTSAVPQPGGGDRQAAREELEDATRASPTYDLVLWNLGVLELGDSPRELLSHPLDPLLAQGHLARAIQLNATLGADQLEPEFEQDEHLYRGGGAPPYALVPFEQAQAWTAAALGAFALLAGLTALVRIGGVTARERGLRAAEGLVERRGGAMADRAGRALRALGRLPGRRHPWLATLPVLAVLTTVSAALDAPTPGAVLWILFAVAVGLAARELGHWIWARSERVRSSAAVWGWGFPLSLLLTVLPVSVAVGPYVGHRTEPPDAEAAFGVSLSGVLTNVAVFVAAFTLLLVYPVPALRLLATVQLGIIGWSLLPFEPLDGWVLLRHRPLVHLGIMAALVAVAVALAVAGGWLLS